MTEFCLASTWTELTHVQKSRWSYNPTFFFHKNINSTKQGASQLQISSHARARTHTHGNFLRQCQFWQQAWGGTLEPKALVAITAHGGQVLKRHPVFYHSETEIYGWNTTWGTNVWVLFYFICAVQCKCMYRPSNRITSRLRNPTSCLEIIINLNNGRQCTTFNCRATGPHSNFLDCKVKYTSHKR